MKDKDKKRKKKDSEERKSMQGTKISDKYIIKKQR